MAVTTRDYNLTTSRPKDVIQSLHNAFTDLGWFEAQPLGYLCNFTNSPGSTLRDRANERYLVTANSTTAPAGTGAVFDVFRSPVGAISAVTIVTGGEGYYVRGLINCASTGTNVAITVGNTSGINPGMLVTKIAGTGTLNVNTTVLSVTNSSQIILDQAPSVTLSAAVLQFADTLTLAANSIGGNTYVISSTGTSGQSNVVVSNADPVFVGQRVSGGNVGALATVTSIVGNTVTLSRNLFGNVSGNLTFSDEITIITTSTVNIEDVSGFASGVTIANVASNSNIYLGATIEMQNGGIAYSNTNGRLIISTITGTGPYTLTLRNEENTFKGFTNSNTVTFRASSGTDINWFEIDSVTAPQTYVWAVAKIKNSTDKLGTTFWHFYAGYNTALYNGIFLAIKPMTGFNPYTNSAQGVGTLDWYSSALSTSVAASTVLNIVSSPFVSSMLRVRQSGIDSNFATFAFFEGNNNRNPFIISKYNSATQPWTNYNDVFLGGVYEIAQNPAYNTFDSAIVNRTKVAAIPKRMAEAGYGNYNLAATAAGSFTTTAFRTNTGNRMQITPAASYGDVALYSRQKGDVQTTLSTTYPIFKNIPISPYFLPVPYYIPEDFVLVEIPWQNPSIRDTITVSNTEIYTIIQSAVNQIALTGTFTGLVLAARTT